MSAGLLALYSFGGEVNLYPLVYYGLKAMSNRGDYAVAYIYGGGGLRRVEVDLSREEAVEARGVAAVGCVYTEDCCREAGDGAACVFGRGFKKLGEAAGDAAYVGVDRSGALYAYRPPRFWHLAVGAHGFDFAIVATETAAIEVLGGEVRRSLRGGELLKITRLGVEARGGGPARELCAMEFIYASRLDSEIDGVEVAAARARLAELLAKRVKASVDVVVGVPDTGLYYAAWVAKAIGAWHVPGFVATTRKRSALLDEVKERISAIQLKANVVRHSVRGKGVLVIDDSLISGLTLRQIAQLLRLRAGAREVHAATAAPPLRRQCPHGVKMPPEEHMIFNHLDHKTVEAALEVDSLAYLEEEEVRKAIGTSLCTYCLLGR
ncbi:phosphoribosyltransferase family protein [Pyrobaculum sp.]|uniref:phosphoribosyltransferase family protein n=1 Tax=Pyrobaculum sp. TaxID=2004705 RepID=UPI003D0DF3DF